MQVFDLKASRCPDAMLYIRRAIEAANKAMYVGDLELRTIEPSIIRDLPYFIEQTNGIEIVEHHVMPLPEGTKREWIESEDAIEEDVGNIDMQLIFRLSFK